MSIRLLHRVLRNGKNLLFGNKRYVYQYRPVQTQGQSKHINNKLSPNILAEINALRENNITRFSRRLLIDNVLSRITSPKSYLLRAEATKKFAFGDSLPFLSLVGCSLASGNGMLTKEDELEGICWEIREAVSKYQSKLEDKIFEKNVSEELELSDFIIGPPLAKGCSAVVYAAKFKSQNVDTTSKKCTFESELFDKNQKENITSNENLHSSLKLQTTVISNETLSKSTLISVENIKPMEEMSPSTSRRAVKFNDEIQVFRSRSRSSSTSSSNEMKSQIEEKEDTSIYQYPWALKMMFNYDIQSNAMAILRAMHKETIPARGRLERNDAENWEKAIIDQTTFLPPHANVVLMPAFFCDQIPSLKNSLSLYPSALPARLNPSSGYGRNMSLFLLMKRYNCTLREYLENSSFDIRTRIILFAQLLEAVAHINNHQIAHRDLKSDNILIDETSDSLPILVLSDFGCCLADRKHGLRLPYQSFEIDKGGNVQLLAPEIITKTPSLFSVLNYSKADLWASATIAYEIFGHSNPFYDGPQAALKNTDYDESMLPTINEEVPYIVRKLIENILQRNPSKRLNCDVAANVLELYLWAPSSWIKFGRNPSNNEILEWLLSLTTKVLCERGLGAYNNADFMTKSRRTYTEYVLISTFLSRAKLRNIRKALVWIQSSL